MVLTFTAAQAAQKVVHGIAERQGEFTAAQAAQKQTKANETRDNPFTAAQAAQKCTCGWGDSSV